jgi:hypothetical protein
VQTIGVPWEEPGASEAEKKWLQNLGAVALAVQRCRAAVDAADRRTTATLTKSAASTVAASGASTKSTSAAFEALVSAAVGLPIGYDARRFPRSELSKSAADIREDAKALEGCRREAFATTRAMRGAARLQPLDREEEWKLPTALRRWLTKQRAHWREGLLPSWQCNLLHLLGTLPTTASARQ